MRNLAATQTRRLEELFPGRSSFSRRERSMYSHDVGALPGLIKPLLGSTQPAAVVQPASEQEVIELARWARAEGMPLVPRGKSTSGYGGVLPIRGGVVVDFVRLASVVRVEGEQVTVEPGISWKKLDEHLRKQGLTLRLYPSSYPSSTVGGWLAQGGAGFGSWRHGWFADNVVSARAVLGDGRVREFQGRDLELLSEAEGITGLITQVTLKVMPAVEPSVTAAAFDSAAAVGKFLSSLAARADLSLWSVSFINPTMARLANQSPLRTHHGHPVHERVLLPEKYLVTLASSGAGGNGARDARGAAKDLPAVIAAHGGELLSRELADHEWAERFNIMRVKRLGPSLVPAEVVVPLAGLAALLGELDARVRHPLAIEGMGVAGKEVVLLGFIPHDQRRFGFNLAFPLSLDGHQSGQTARRPGVRHGVVLRARGGERAGRGAPGQAGRLQGRGRPHGHPEPRQGAFQQTGRPHGPGLRVRAPAAPLRQRGEDQTGGADRETDGQERAAGHRLVRLRLFGLRLLRGRVRPVLRQDVGEPVSSRQVVLPA